MDEKSIIVVAAFQQSEALKRAKSLLRMATKSSDTFERSSAAGAAVIVAIGYLAQSVEFRLIQALANAEGADGRCPDEATIRAQMPPGLPARMRLLSIVQYGARFRLDERKQETQMLLGCIRLRNRLIHDSGEYRIGFAESLGTIEDGKLMLRIEIPQGEWDKVTVDYAEALVNAAEAFGHDFDHLSDAPSAHDSEFFRVVPSRSTPA